MIRRIPGTLFCLALAAASLDTGAQTQSIVTVITYHDDRDDWVLGQHGKVTENGIVTEETTFDAVAQPQVRKAFGRIESTSQYHTDGTVASVRDGIGNTTSYANWKRGIPQSVTFADGAQRSAVVDNLGRILTVTSEAGAKTCYTYDAMGRLASMTLPSELAPGTCDASTWNGMTRTFEPYMAASHGLAAGHWREVERRGNALKVVLYDALWRPVLLHASDANDIAGTSSETVTRYDAQGRVVFASYPVRDITDIHQPLTGTRTTYDTLGRVTRVEQDSELGVLATTTAYLHDARGPHTLVTDPRGGQTRTWYQMFDQPDYTRPVSIAHPEGVSTGIARDSFGKPTSITRSGPGS